MDNKQKLEVHSVYNIMKYWENKYKKKLYIKWGCGERGKEHHRKEKLMMLECTGCVRKNYTILY